MLPGTRNVMVLMLISGFLFTNWNYCADIYTPATTKIETNVFKYGLIYYSAGSTENRIDIEPPAGFKSFRQFFEKKFIVKTRRTGNKFYHQFYKNRVNDNEVEYIAISTPPVTPVNPGKMALPFSPCQLP
jgi:hypothetical protein